MTENKMADVAAMFGKKLGEEFKIKYDFFYTVPVVARAKFTTNGFVMPDMSKIAQTEDRVMLSSEHHIAFNQLLTGQAVIVDESW